MFNFQEPTTISTHPRESAGGRPCRRYPLENILTATFFVTALTAFSLTALYKCTTPAPTLLVHENRAPHQFPRMRSLKKDIATFAPQFEAFLNDRFPERSELISIRNFFSLRALHSAGASIVGLGRRNYLFFFQPNVLHAQINYKPLSNNAAEVWADGLNIKREYLNAHNIKYVFFIVPEKGSIYAENLPPGLKRQTGESSIEGVQRHLRQNGTVPFIDVKEILMSNKARAKDTTTPLYYIGDTHWNMQGALLAMKALAEYLPCPMPTYKLSSKTFEGDLVRMLNLEGRLDERVPEVKIDCANSKKISDEQVPYFKKYEHPSWAYQNSDKSLPRTFIIHDSFINNMLDFINEMSSYALYCWTREFDAHAILEQKPDMVIEEVCERYLYDVNPPNVPRSVEIVKKPINPYATIGDGAGHPALASFDDRFELVDASSQHTDGGQLFRLLWRSNVKQKLVGTVQLHLLMTNGEAITERQYAQDSLGRNVDVDSQWVDTIAISADELQKVSKLGVILFEPGKGCLPVQAKDTDSWSSRAILPLSILLDNVRHFEKIYHPSKPCAAGLR